MNNPSFFKGQIQVTAYSSLDQSKASRKLMGYEIKNSIGSKFSETLSHQFKSFNFSKDEKKHLNHKIREDIYAIQNIDQKRLLHDVEIFISQLGKKKAFNLKVEASGYGAFICLTAILNNKLPKNKDIEFLISDAPLALFPKSLCANKSSSKQSNCRIDLVGSTPNSWLCNFKTLMECPQTLPIDQNSDHYAAA